jgi:hypothetical protein
MRNLNYIFIGAICFFLGGGLMYAIDSTWFNDKVEAKQNQANEKLTKYTDALDTSYRMVMNCYDAIYAVSDCIKSENCNAESTIDSLTELNIKRKILKQKLDQLLDGTDTLSSKKGSL